jgi:hypothetical protein
MEANADLVTFVLDVKNRLHYKALKLYAALFFYILFCYRC